MDLPNNKQTSNFLHRDPVQNKMEAELLRQKILLEQQPKSTHTKFYIIIIVLLLCSNLVSIGFIGILASQMQSLIGKKMVTAYGSIPVGEGSTMNQIDPQTGKVVAGINIPPVNSIGNPASNGISASLEQKLNQMQQQNAANISNIYTKSLDMASDTKRKADITAIATTMLVYSMEEEGLPKNFPDKPTCIGTDASCFDLYKLIVPNYLDTGYKDPSHGTDGNSGYMIGTSHDGNTTVTVQATSEAGDIIEIKK